MESGHRTQSNVRILLFHLLAFSTLAGDIVYQHYNVFTVGSKTWAGRLKFLTYINEVGIFNKQGCEQTKHPPPAEEGNKCKNPLFGFGQLTASLLHLNTRWGSFVFLYGIVGKGGLPGDITKQVPIVMTNCVVCGPISLVSL